MALAPMNPMQSRRLALLLLVVALVVLTAPVAGLVWWAHRHYDSALADMGGKLERYRRIAATRPEVTKQLEAMRGKDPRRFFLRSGAAALSAAEAQEAVRGIVEANGGRLISMQALPSREEGRYRQITVNLQLTANIFSLRRILDAIDNNTPFLFVDNLTIRSQVAANFRPPPGQEPEMYVSFDVVGYALTNPS